MCVFGHGKNADFLRFKEEHFAVFAALRWGLFSGNAAQDTASGIYESFQSPSSQVTWCSFMPISFIHVRVSTVFKIPVLKPLP